MTTAAITTFVIIAGFIWGGFVVILTTALRKEAGKQPGGEAP